MPTGYTAGIIDGTIKTFKNYAILCIRAFGAAIHMRDDSLEAQYKPREVDSYHQDNLNKANKQLKELETVSDKVLITQYAKEQQEELKRLQVRLKEVQETKARLERMLKSAQEYNPPTPEHKGYKEFMVNQIEETIKWDGDTSYTDKNIEQCMENIKNPDAAKIRMNILESIKYDINYHTKELKAEKKRVAESNKWVEDAINSIN